MKFDDVPAERRHAVKTGVEMRLFTAILGMMVNAGITKTTDLELIISQCPDDGTRHLMANYLGPLLARAEQGEKPTH